jgi:hypothetical protein
MWVSIYPKGLIFSMLKKLNRLGGRSTPCHSKILLPKILPHPDYLS